MKRPTRPAPLSLRAIRTRDRAQPPPPDPPPDPTPQINELARAARASWLGLLAYFSFVGVTLIGVQDADFFLPERQTQLPLVGVTIPTALFFYIAPALGAALYVYMHLYLMKLWDALAAAPPRLQGAPLSDRILPWLVSDFALRLRGDGAVPARPLWPLAFLVTLALVFLAAPLVLGAFWWRSMPKHDWELTILACGIPLMATLHAGTASALRLWRVTRTPGQPYAPPRRGLGSVAVQALRWSPVWAAVALIGHFRTVEPLDHYAEPLNLARLGWTERGDRDEGSWWNAAPINLAQAQLAGVAFTETPPGWLPYDQAFAAFRLDACRAEGLTPALCGPAGDEAEGDDRANDAATLAPLRAAWCTRQFPAESEDPAASCNAFFTDLETRIAAEWPTHRANARAALRAPTLARVDLRRADLSGARLEGANLRWARMEGANLSEARMEGADIREARMERADLSRARLEGAQLHYARLERALLSQARMEGAGLASARLERASLAQTRLDRAYLWRARMERAFLFEARLEGANLREARLEGANLQWARLEGADLHEASLEGTDLRRADLKGADLWRAQMEGAVLSEARVERADLRSAQMRRANLIGASLDGANLHQADLEEALLRDASIRGANLLQANLRGAILFRARLDDTDLSDADMEDSSLREARLDGTILRGARLEGANLLGARLTRADLRGATVNQNTDLGADNFVSAATLDRVALSSADWRSVRISPEQIKQAFGDASILLPDEVSRPAHWPARALHPEIFETEWRKWQADPATYTPPD